MESGTVRGPMVYTGDLADLSLYTSLFPLMDQSALVNPCVHGPKALDAIDAKRSILEELHDVAPEQPEF